MALDFLALLFVPGKLSAQDRVAAVVSWTKLSNLTIKISDLTTGLTKTYGEPKQKASGLTSRLSWYQEATCPSSKGQLVSFTPPPRNANGKHIASNDHVITNKDIMIPAFKLTRVDLLGGGSPNGILATRTSTLR